ncbi:histidinol-phosphate transaminase [Rhizobium leguminosarum]|uniref:histidinol-phosphate transaminase n=1 Tax=Rhizobium leguminosarum TaxID=384 RepID=UPI001C96FE0E|nr:histidinol-phosphate transaminase [Rhizobium leguminosarum]MBY5360402.1 histidinol-phosphate transaminase [Rhizobium leguminosarum]
MSRFWSDIVSKLRPYVAGEQPRIANMVKLNTNESPYGPSPRALEAIRQAADDRLRLYPDPSAMELRETIAAHFGLTAEEVFVGNGSDEVLAHAFQALLNHERPLLYPDVTYAFYSTYCLLYGVEAIEVPVDDGFRIRLKDYNRSCGAIIIPNPNAPTGIGLPLAGIEALLAAHPDAVVVIDEAYIDFGGESAIPLISTHPNLLVIQTLSKSRSLAGLRIGFALGQRPLIEALERVKDSFNSYPLDRLAQLAATAAIKDEAWFETCRGKIIASRESLVSELEALGFEVLPSQANFVFARHESRSGAALQAALRGRGILVRHFAKPRISDFLRISIGTDEECARLVSALEEIFAA